MSKRAANLGDTERGTRSGLGETGAGDAANFAAGGRWASWRTSMCEAIWQSLESNLMRDVMLHIGRLGPDNSDICAPWDT